MWVLINFPTAIQQVILGYRHGGEDISVAAKIGGEDMCRAVTLTQTQFAENRVKKRVYQENSFQFISTYKHKFTFKWHYRRGTHIRTYGTDVFALDMLSSTSQASGDKSMKPMAFYHVFNLVLWRFLPNF